MRAPSPLALAAALLVPGSLLAAPCATQFLRGQLPELRPADVLRARSRDRSPMRDRSPQHEVGASKEFWAWDLSVMPPGFRRVTATCRVVSDQAYLFVEDELASSGKVTPQDVRTLDTAMHRRSPAWSVAPRKGILDIATEAFGPPPDTLDGDPRVYFLVLRMDTFNGMGFDGYFNAFDQLPEDVAWGQYQQHSNEAEVLYLNGLRGDIASAYMRGVLAHEYTHLVEFGFDPEEFNWLSESVAEGAMQLSGYFTDNAHVRRYAAHPESPLVRDQYANYGAGFLFSAYLRGAYGAARLGELLRDPGHGTASVEGVLAEAGAPQGFEELHAAWADANLRAGQGRRVREYRHPALIVPAFSLHASLPAEGGAVAGELSPWGIHYVELAPGGYSLTRSGDARLYELLPGRDPRPLLACDDEARLETLDEPRWILVVGEQSPTYELQATAQ